MGPVEGEVKQGLSCWGLALSELRDGRSAGTGAQAGVGEEGVSLMTEGGETKGL